MKLGPYFGYADQSTMEFAGKLWPVIANLPLIHWTGLSSRALMLSFGIYEALAFWMVFCCNKTASVMAGSLILGVEYGLYVLGDKFPMPKGQTVMSTRIVHAILLAACVIIYKAPGHACQMWPSCCNKLQQWCNKICPGCCTVTPVGKAVHEPAKKASPRRKASAAPASRSASSSDEAHSARRTPRRTAKASPKAASKKSK